MIAFLILLSAFDYSLKSRIDFVYDNNIFAYSPKYLQEFIKQVHPERFPFETYDDFYTNYVMQLLIRNKFLSQYTTTINFNFTGYNYSVNQQKDYMILSTGIRQSLGKWATKIEYLFLSNYLIRYYKKLAGSQYIGCEFNEKLFSSKIDIKLKQQVDIGILLDYETDDYIENFDVYDSKAVRFGPNIDFSLSRIIESKLNYEFKSSKAKGPVPDISYIQHKFALHTCLKTCFPKFSQLLIGYQLRFRLYTTEVSPVLDTPHNGREDISQRFNCDWEFPLFSTLYVSAGYSYEFRRSHSEVYPDIGIYKDYNKWTISGGIEFEY